MNVLIVDDLQGNRKLLRAQLEAEGHAVLEADNGEAALAALAAQSVDLIISDILMPVMDGYRLCAEVRAMERTREIPFIFYTATYTSPADEQLSYDLGGDAYLRKPLRTADLVAAIDRVLASPRRAPSITAQQQEALKEYSERLVVKLEQKNVELAAASDRLRLQAAALDSVADAVVITDVDGTISWVNRAFEQYTGTATAEAMGKTVSSLDIGLQDIVFTRLFWETYPDPVWRTESLITRGDGSPRYDEVTVTPVRAPNHDITNVVAVLPDVTARRQAEERLRESDRRFRSVLANLNLIAVMLDRDARITWCNDHLLRLTGWHRDEILGRDWFETFVPADRGSDTRKMFAALFREGSDASHHETEIVTRDRKRLLIQWSNTALQSFSGEIVETASIGQDITGQNILRQQRLRAQRLESLGALAGGIAHDLNNLFMPILLGATTLKRLEPKEQSRRVIDNIERSVRRGSELVKQVLLFARGAEMSRQAVSVEEIVREVGSIAHSTFPRNISIDVSIAPHLPRVIADATQLSQVLLNLCVNARDAMPEGGRISINVRSEDVTEQFARRHGGTSPGAYVVLEVMDTGTGMPKEMIDRIFDPFFTTKEVGKGTGLGLSTVQGIASSHGGFIHVSSEVGHGSTFRVYIPAGTADHHAAPAEEGKPEPVRGQGELVMVVDDDLTVVSMTSQTLEAFGYRVLAAESGADAIALYSQRHDEIAVVLTDIAMPVVDGHALIAALHRIDPNVRVIAATANTGTSQLAKLEKASVTHVLTKPYTADQLLRTVAVALSVVRV